MIKAESLTKRFGNFTAIEDVSFEVARGEIVGFLGPNGAGKSTTMRILSGVFPPTSGAAAVAGHDVVTESLASRAEVGYFPERVALYADMTVAECLQYVSRIKRIPRNERAVAIERALEACNLEQVSHRLIGTLSKGFRQRAGIAQALVGDPAVLILDEPTAGLDPEQVAEMRERVSDLRGERTVILSTHILSEVEATCDRVIIINRGKILAVDTPANLNRRLRPVSQVYVELAGSAGACVERIQAIDGVLDVEPLETEDSRIVRLRVDTDKERDLRGEIARAVAGTNASLLEIRPVSLSLEDIFLNIVATPAEA